MNNRDRDFHGRFLKGHFQSEETNNKISQALSGRILSEETKARISKSKIGKLKLSPKICPSCKKYFQPTKSIIIYCSRSCGRKGKPPWNKNTKGLTKPNSTSFKKGQFSKDKHPKWRGGITTEESLVRSSVEYKKWRLSVLSRDNYICQICKTKVGGKKAHVDHIKNFNDYPELRLDINNGRTLCASCHHKTPDYAGKNKIAQRKRNNKGMFE